LLVTIILFHPGVEHHGTGLDDAQIVLSVLCVKNKERTECGLPVPKGLK
jgi:hypothetical protein